MTVNIKKINTSYWQRDDPEWVTQREADWPDIEFMLTHRKTKKKAINPIKDYYLRGKMPNWKGFKEWDDEDRHLDLFMFLWLHPSWDKAVLTALRDAYIASDLIVYDDVRTGAYSFLSSQITMSCIWYQYPKKRISNPDLKGKGPLLLDVIMGDPAISQYEIEDRAGNGRGRKLIFEFPSGEYSNLVVAAGWLRIENILPINQEMLLQYDNALEWWYRGVAHDDDYFEKKQNKNKDIDVLGQYYIALYRIHHFDTQKSTNTCQINFAHKIRKILDEREFVPFFKQMWLDVKAGKVEVKNAWERDKRKVKVEIKS